MKPWIVLLHVMCISSTWADGWPHWRGPGRNDVVSESSQFDVDGWKSVSKLWQENVGEGAASPIVIGSRIYTFGWADGKDHVVCLDAGNGKELWRQTYSCPEYGRKATGDEGLYAGPTATPEFDSESEWLYTLSCDGDLCCWDTKADGVKIWQRNLYDQFDVPQRAKVGRSGLRDYGYTSSPLIHGSTLIVEVGAKSGTLIGFDKRSGKTLWQSEAKSSAGHTGGPVPMLVEGVPCVAVHNFDGLLVTRLDVGREGKTVATYDWKTEFANNIATPAVRNDSVIITSHYNHVKIARLKISLSGAVKEWEQDFASKVCSPVIHEGHVYWAWQQVMCLDFRTGRLVWQGGKTGDAGSCIATSDGRLIVWSGRGDLSLLESANRSPDQYTELAMRRILTRTDAWPHVVLADKHLYCKDRAGELACLRLSPAPPE